MISISIFRHEDFRVDIRVTDSEYLPLEIFLYRIDTNNVEIFSGVCVMEELNIHLEPTVDNPFFRKDYFTTSRDSAFELEEYITEVQDKIKTLEGNYKIYLESHMYGQEQIVEIEGE